MTVIVCVPALIYALTLGGRSDRTIFLAIWVIALIGGLVAFLLPWQTIIRSRWRELAFLTWTLLDLALIGLAAITDGGPDSPVTWLVLRPDRIRRRVISDVVGDSSSEPSACAATSSSGSPTRSRSDAWYSCSAASALPR